MHTIFLAGPGHGGPAAVASAYLNGTYGEVYPPHITQDAEGLRKLLRQFSFPGGWHSQSRRTGDTRLDPRRR